MDRHGTLKKGEKLLKAGKVEQGLDVLRGLGREAGDDPLTLNRVADLVARFGEQSEAVEYYRKIAAGFEGSGFLPKAIAMYKKILRMHPGDVEAGLSLGMLYLRQKLPGEARGFLLKAAERALAESDAAKAREIYQKLVLAEPEVAAHRARLAETLALEGESDSAAGQLVELGRRLAGEGQYDEAESSFRRALELEPAHPEALLGMSGCLARAGRAADALELLEQEIERRRESGSGPVHELLGEIALVHEIAGDEAASMAILGREDADQIPHSLYRRIFAHHLDQGAAVAVWERLGPSLRKWVDRGRSPQLVGLLDALSDLEPEGHIPALQWLVDLLRERSDRVGLGRALERLVEAYRHNGMIDEAETALAQLAEVAPGSRLLASDAPKAPAEASAGEGIPLSDEAAPEEEVPAVPLDRNDEGFVTGRLTQAEILEKYGLASQAIAQVEEVVERFPGHVEAQQRLVALLRSQSDPGPLAKALVGLAFAARAEGDVETGANAALEAVQTGMVQRDVRGKLRRLGLLESLPAEEAPDQAAPAAAAPVPPAPPVEAAPAAPVEGDDELVLIDFDAETENAPAPQPAAQDLLTDADGEALLDDDDLSALTAALDSELFEDAVAEPVPDEGAEQSVDEVFAQFREQVSELVDDEDHQTHYDLGIAYKEMGLLDEAIDEFSQAVRSKDKLREACVMLARCHGERGDAADAESWYRKAIELPCDDASSDASLRYEFGELMLGLAKTDEALTLFRDVMASDPSFRDVQSRVAELEAQQSV